MSIEFGLKDRLAFARPTGPQTVRRALLLVALAAVEGIAAGAIVFLTALVYHLFVLGTQLHEFNWPLYALFGATNGAIFATYSAVALNRFLNGRRQPRLTVPDAVFGWTAATAITLLISFGSGSIGDLSRVTLTASYVLGIPLVIGLRHLLQSGLMDRISNGALQFETVALVGERPHVIDFLLNGELWRNGHRLTGVLYVDDAVDETGALRPEAVAEFARTNIRHGTESVVIVGTLDDFDHLERLVVELKRFAINVLYAPATTNRTLKFIDVVPVGPNNALMFTRKPMSDWAVALKRAVDIVLSGVGLLVLLPFFLLVAIAIRLDSPGSVIYRQERRGFNGETFMIWKFRSMRVTEDGRAMKRQASAGDDRITRVGRFIRSTSIDELPQLINVLAGQMSLVGPRPHAVSHDDELSQRLESYAHRQRIKPGITGWAQVNGYRGETRTAEQLAGRTAHDLHYVDNWSIFLDVWILVLTVVSPQTRRNAH